MQTITLYRYTRPNGGVTVSTVKPSGEYTDNNVYTPEQCPSNWEKVE